jgi:hypothetical protein
MTFGVSELVVRFIPALFGIATLVSAAWIGYAWMTPVGATVLVLLCSLGEWLSFYSVELKPYSADAFCGLFLPALTAWAFDATEDDRKHALLLWGVAVIIGHWFSLAAVFVLPACTAACATAGVGPFARSMPGDAGSSVPPPIIAQPASATHNVTAATFKACPP